MIDRLLGVALVTFFGNLDERVTMVYLIYSLLKRGITGARGSSGGYNVGNK